MTRYRILPRSILITHNLNRQVSGPYGLVNTISTCANMIPEVDSAILKLGNGLNLHEGDPQVFCSTLFKESRAEKRLGIILV